MNALLAVLLSSTIVLVGVSEPRNKGSNVDAGSDTGVTSETEIEVAHTPAPTSTLVAQATPGTGAPTSTPAVELTVAVEEPTRVPPAPTPSPAPAVEPTTVPQATVTPAVTSTPVPQVTATLTVTPSPVQPTATRNGAPLSCESEGQTIYGPVNGQVASAGNIPDGDAPREIAASSYEASIVFTNPDSDPWEYGLGFIDSYTGAVNVVSFKSDGIWLHGYSADGDRNSHEVLDGNSLLSLETGPGSLNELSLLVDGVDVEVIINESNLTSFTLGVADGDIQAVVPFYGFTQAELPGAAQYAEFSVTCR